MYHPLEYIRRRNWWKIITTALCNRAGHYSFAMWFLSIFLPVFFSSLNLSGRRCLPYFYTWCGPSANLECRSEMCCARLAGNAGPKKSPKLRHLGTIAQICRAISSQRRHIDNRKKPVKQQYLPHVSLQSGELRPTSDWDLLASLRHPSKFQRVLRLGSVTTRHSIRGRQPNFAALNRGRYLYSAGRPSRWALSHISSFGLIPNSRFLIHFIHSFIYSRHKKIDKIW